MVNINNEYKGEIPIKPGFINIIEVDALFGRYSYRIEVPHFQNGDISRIAMLYGDNGTGKTTILKLLHNLLSPSMHRGHRTYITRVPFKSFKVIFSSGTKIEVKRDKTNLIGAYYLCYEEQAGMKYEGLISLNSEGEITYENTAKQIIQIIGKLGLAVYLLGDDRVLQSDQFEDIENEGISETTSVNIRRDLIRRKNRSTISNIRNVELHQLLDRTERWFRQRSFIASTRGEEESQHIYARIIETINRIGLPEAETYEQERTKLISELNELGKRSNSFQRFGLIPKIDNDRFINSLNNTPAEELPFVLQVLRSFVNGQKARLQQIDSLYNQLNRFINLINGFFRDKYIEIDAREGISILVGNGQKLEPENLSSGEKQLLLLFCNVLTSSEEATLFLIDEPEISLNVKWQRKLVDSLIKISGENKCQFLLATHSIELLTKHVDQTIKLG